jgi:hypothetical protein
MPILRFIVGGSGEIEYEFFGLVIGLFEEANKKIECLNIGIF